MWSITYDKWNECWFVAEYTRSEDTLSYFWRSDAESACSYKNSKRFELRETYDTEEANDIWPGGTVSYGGSRG